MTRRLAALGAVAVLAFVLTACGRYGPPRRIPVVPDEAPVAEEAAEDENTKKQDTQ